MSNVQGDNRQEEVVKWSAEKILEYSRKRLDQNESLGGLQVHRDDPKLYMAGLRYFGSWEAIEKRVREK